MADFVDDYFDLRLWMNQNFMLCHFEVDKFVGVFSSKLWWFGWLVFSWFKVFQNAMAFHFSHRSHKCIREWIVYFEVHFLNALIDGNYKKTAHGNLRKIQFKVRMNGWLCWRLLWSSFLNESKNHALSFRSRYICWCDF